MVHESIVLQETIKKTKQVEKLAKVGAGAGAGTLGGGAAGGAASVTDQLLTDGRLTSLKRLPTSLGELSPGQRVLESI
ncbi:hypothetical protein [Celeribacter baekdonensis]|uniref:hypothetical protein n=1 Tax=Celeribacter baekdonensis TaxID=875171 RepID=UPI00131F2505|nr:hypothetical protein [Celeribacter baekdonensis]